MEAALAHAMTRHVGEDGVPAGARDRLVHVRAGFGSEGAVVIEYALYEPGGIAACEALKGQSAKAAHRRDRGELIDVQLDEMRRDALHRRLREERRIGVSLLIRRGTHGGGLASMRRVDIDTIYAICLPTQARAGRCDRAAGDRFVHVVEGGEGKAPLAVPDGWKLDFVCLKEDWMLALPTPTTLTEIGLPSAAARFCPSTSGTRREPRE